MSRVDRANLWFDRWRWVIWLGLTIWAATGDDAFVAAVIGVICGLRLSQRIDLYGREKRAKAKASKSTVPITVTVNGKSFAGAVDAAARDVERSAKRIRAALPTEGAE